MSLPPGDGGLPSCLEKVNLVWDIEDSLNSLYLSLHKFKADDQYERCGVVVGCIDRRGWRVPVLVEVENTHVDPENHFRISPSDYTKARRKFSGMLMGILHTHPGYDLYDAYPSNEDMDTARTLPHMNHWVYHPYTRRLSNYHNLGVSFRTYIRPRWRSNR